jgi:hypothetical protein
MLALELAENVDYSGNVCHISGVYVLWNVWYQ